MDPGGIAIRPLTPDDAEAFRTLRLEALQREPHAFAESAVEHQARTLDEIAARLRASSTPENFVLGAFAGRLVGTAGFARFERIKARHKGLIWGVYVSGEQRGKGTGRALLSELIGRARRLPGLEQINLTVNASQHAARGLYISLGFKSFGREPGALKIDGIYIDEDLMALRL